MGYPFPKWAAVRPSDEAVESAPCSRSSRYSLLNFLCEQRSPRRRARQAASAEVRRQDTLGSRASKSGERTDMTGRSLVVKETGSGFIGGGSTAVGVDH